MLFYCTYHMAGKSKYSSEVSDNERADMHRDTELYLQGSSFPPPPHTQGQPWRAREFTRSTAIGTSQHPAPQANLDGTTDISTDQLCTSGKREVNGAELR